MHVLSPRSSLLAAAALLLATASWQAPQVEGLDGSVRIAGLNYNTRKGPDWAPDAQKCKAQREVETDLRTLKSVTDRVRIYSLVDCNQARLVLPAAKNAGLQVALGIWTTADAGFLQVEKNKLIELIDAGLVDDNVVALHVGSEAVYRKDITADTAVAYMQEIKQLLVSRGIHIPVTIADVVDSYYQNPQLIDAVDVVSINQFSFWERTDVAEGVSVMLDRLRDLRITAAKKGKGIMISETGWSSAGTNVNASVASPENQALFFKNFYHQAKAHDLDYYWFSGFDSQWRVDNGDHEVEAAFGVFQEDQQLKRNYQSLQIGDRKPHVLRALGVSRRLAEKDGGVFLRKEPSPQEWLETEQTTWLWDHALGQLRSLNSDRCLDAYEPWDGGVVHVFKCMDGENNQKWTYDSKAQTFRHAVHKGFCLDNDAAHDNHVHLWSCSEGNVNQQWQLAKPSDPVPPSPSPTPTATPTPTPETPTDSPTEAPIPASKNVVLYTKETQGKANAKLLRSPTSEDGLVFGFGAPNADLAEWVIDAEAHMVRSADGKRCLDGYEGWDGGRVHTWACDSNERNQKWHFDAATGQFKHDTHKGFCLDGDLAANDGAGNVQLWGCHLNNNNQVWRAVAANANAVSITNADKTVVEFVSQDELKGKDASAAAVDKQTWFWDAARATLTSKWNNECLDAYEAQDNGRVHTWGCNGGDNQSWRYDAKSKRVVHAAHKGFCLSYGATSTKQLVLKTCADNDDTQSFTLA